MKTILKTSLIYSTALLLLFAGKVFSQEAILGTEAQQQAGKKIYDAKCSQCHGYDGDANSVGKEFFRPQPRAFTSSTFKFRSTPSGELPTHEDIKESIRLGMPGTGMPAWPNLSDEELSNIAYYLKTFAEEDFIDYGADAKPLAFPDPPAYTEVSARQGRKLYESNQCLNCHGDLGLGDGLSAPTLVDQWNIPIRPADLSKRWTYRGGATRADIYQTFVTGLDGSPMPSYDIKPVDSAWALVDYVYSLGESDEPNFASAVYSEGTRKEINLADGPAMFADAPRARFPIVGQVVEPGRSFYPGVNDVVVQSIHNADNIAIMVSWNDMTAETGGFNSPTLKAPLFDRTATAKIPKFGSDSEFSDAIALMFPATVTEGSELPYFMFGDSKRPMTFWYSEMAGKKPQVFGATGSNSITEKAADGLSMSAAYNNGQWQVIFVRNRFEENGLSFDTEKFVPLTFSVWDGFNEERGNKRGISAWYYLYVTPLEKPSPVGPMTSAGLYTLLALLGIVGLVRMRSKDNENQID